MTKEILESIAEDKEEQTGERDYELDRQIGHGSDEELMELLEELGF